MPTAIGSSITPVESNSPSTNPNLEDCCAHLLAKERVKCQQRHDARVCRLAIEVLSRVLEFVPHLEKLPREENFRDLKPIDLDSRANGVEVWRGVHPTLVIGQRMVGYLERIDAAQADLRLYELCWVY